MTSDRHIRGMCHHIVCRFVPALTFRLGCVFSHMLEGVAPAEDVVVFLQ
jgi:hypothetical protein